MESRTARLTSRAKERSLKWKLSSLVHPDRTYALYFFVSDDFLFVSFVKMRRGFLSCLVSSLQQTEFGISKLAAVMGYYDRQEDIKFEKLVDRTAEL